MSEQTRTRFLVEALGLFVAVFVAAYLPIAVAKHDAAIAPIWPANALIVVALLRAPRAQRPRWDLKIAATAGLLLANLAAEVAPVLSFWFTFANGLEVAVTLALLRTGLAMQLPVRQHGSLWVSVFAGLVGPLLGACVGSAGLSLLLSRPPGPLWLEWYIPAALNMLIVVPAGLLLRAPRLPRLDKACLIDAFFCVLAPAVIAWIAVRNPQVPLLFLVSPTIVAAAWRRRTLGVALAIVSCACVATPIISGADGAIALASYVTAQERVLIMQVFLLVQTCLGLLISGILERNEALVRALRAEHAAAVQQNQAKLRLLMSVSHEIRTPLNVIQTSCDILERGQRLNETDRELLSGMSASSRQLQDLAHDLLDSARLKQAEQPLRREWFIAREAIDRAIADTRASLGDHATAVVTTVAAEKIWADIAQFQRIVRNLVSNALKHGRNHGAVSVGVMAIDDHIRIEVRDRGPGFTPGAASTAFQAFPQHGPHAADGRSAGVGLSLVKDIVEAHGGRVGIFSTPHVETCIWVELPLSEHASQQQSGSIGDDSSQIDPDAVFGP